MVGLLLSPAVTRWLAHSSPLTDVAVVRTVTHSLTNTYYSHPTTASKYAPLRLLRAVLLLPAAGETLLQERIGCCLLLRLDSLSIHVR